MAKARHPWLQRPSWLVVLIAGGLFVSFSVAIVREVINGHQVRQQVQLLERQVATEQQRQTQLQELIDYLGSPTFQEQEARLKLGLKKNGEQVIVVPTSSSPVNGNNKNTVDSTLSDTAPQPPLQRWWTYFFGSLPTSSHSKA